MYFYQLSGAWCILKPVKTLKNKQKSLKTSKIKVFQPAFWVCLAPRSWSKYTTQQHWDVGLLMSRLKQSFIVFNKLLMDMRLKPLQIQTYFSILLCLQRSTRSSDFESIIWCIQILTFAVLLVNSCSQDSRKILPYPSLTESKKKLIAIEHIAYLDSLLYIQSK